MDIRTKVRHSALNLLARREHSRSELILKLSRKEFPDELIDEIVTELIQENLQSDYRYTEIYLRSKANRGYGPVKIVYELRNRGITEELIANALSKGEHDWFVLAKEQRIRKFGSELPQDFAAKAKQSRFLQSRGFTLEQIRYAFEL